MGKSWVLPALGAVVIGCGGSGGGGSGGNGTGASGGATNGGTGGNTTGGTAGTQPDGGLGGASNPDGGTPDAGCVPSCAGKSCGEDDGCGSPCQTGSCTGGTCVNGACVCAHVDCVGVCCGAGDVCANGSCCTPNCAGLECGTDPVCGTPCGSCSSGVCNAGACSTTCVPTAPKQLAKPYRARRSALIVDGAGIPHAIYWGDDDQGVANAYRVFHSTNASGTWTQEYFDTIDQWGADVFADGDANNWIHAGYEPIATTGGPMRYAQNTNGTWSFQWPSLGGNYMRFAAAPDGSVHYIKSPSNPGGLVYMTNQSGSFVTENVNAGGESCELHMDQNAKAHIVCVGGFLDYQLVYFTNASGSWVAMDTGVPVLKGGKMLGLDFALDSAGKVHAVYVSGGGVHYATNASGSFTSVVVDAAGDPYPSIAATPAGKVHVVFPSGGKLRRAHNLSGSWQFADVDDVPMESTSQTRVDAIGRVHVLYRVGGASSVEPPLKYAAFCP